MILLNIALIKKLILLGGLFVTPIQWEEVDIDFNNGVVVEDSLRNEIDIFYKYSYDSYSKENINYWNIY